VLQRLTLSIIAFSVSASVASAAAINFGATYQLHNHPDGSLNPPPYGLRLDNLYDAPNDSNDRFTFDFDDAASDMRMTISGDGSTIRIFGVVLGGRDIGNMYAADQYLGLYEVDYTYSFGVGMVPGDDDLEVTVDTGNGGTLTPLAVIDGGPSVGGGPFALGATFAGGNVFRLGDENNDNGHRGFAGISGWGWITVDGERQGGGADDWIFTAELIPEPATMGLLLMGAPLVLRRRR